MTHKIAIITPRILLFQDYDGYDIERKIIDSITDWEEVSDEDFKLLQFASTRLDFRIIERPVDTPKFIAKTIADYKAFAKVEEQKEAEEKAKREAAALERKFKKELKDRVSKEKMLAKLVEELGPDALKRATNIS